MVFTGKPLSTGQFLLVLIGGIIGITLYGVLVRMCHNFAFNTGKQPHSALKIGLIALAPFLTMVVAMFQIEIPYRYCLILMILCSVIVLIWNLTTLGVFGGILFSVMHIVAGFLAGVSVAAMIIVGIFAIILIFFGEGGSIDTSENSSVSGNCVRDLETGEVFYVETGINGVKYVKDRDAVLRNSDYSGQFFDDNGHRYVSC